ncbi:AMP-binding protein [Kribbella sp. DT2]|uniref:AMP-binding protein n=1 Tax=Kribbella sp. DT2 TaxID=3393427 RepID=UPI003CEB7BC0
MRITEKVRAVGVLRAAGMVEPARPVLAVRKARAIRRLGPIAGAAQAAAWRMPDAVAVIDESGRLTYGELDRRSGALARGWLAAGLAPGEAVGVLGRDHRGVVEAMVAAGKLGARLVLLNTGFSDVQLTDVVRREGVGGLVCDDEFEGMAAAVRRLPLEGAEGSSLPWPRTQGGLVLLTGGTTGTPKGAPRVVRSPLVAAQFLDRVPLRRTDVVQLAAPLFHGTALTQFIMAFALGATVVLRRRFDPAATLATVERERSTALIVVPTMLQRMLAVERTFDTSSLRIIMSAGALLPTDLGNRVIDRFGPVLHNLYGSTECAVATVATPSDWLAAPGTTGRPPVGCKVRLYDDAGRPVTAPGTTGRIFAGNGLSFGGYSGGGSKEIVGGLLSTGDLGHFDANGRLFVDGRSDDMIVSGGENVFPGEVEDLVEAMPGVAEVASVGVPDHDFGRRLRLYVVPAAGAELDAEEIRVHVRNHLARFKVPREVVFLDELPRTATGKIDRRALVNGAAP